MHTVHSLGNQKFIVLWLCSTKPCLAPVLYSVIIVLFWTRSRLLMSLQNRTSPTETQLLILCLTPGDLTLCTFLHFAYCNVPTSTHLIITSHHNLQCMRYAGLGLKTIVMIQKQLKQTKESSSAYFGLCITTHCVRRAHASPGPWLREDILLSGWMNLQSTTFDTGTTQTQESNTTEDQQLFL